MLSSVVKKAAQLSSKQLFFVAVPVKGPAMTDSLNINVFHTTRLPERDGSLSQITANLFSSGLLKRGSQEKE